MSIFQYDYSRSRLQRSVLQWAVLGVLGFLIGAQTFFGQKAKDSTKKLLTGKERYEYARDLTVRVNIKTASGEGVGSGVWVSREGYVATCFHVVKDSSEGQINVGVGGPDWIDFRQHNVVHAAFNVHKAKMVASDPETDVAILEVDKNPFVSPPFVVVSTPTETVVAKVEAARLSDEIPTAREKATVAGYPVTGTDFVIQNGNVAGVGFPMETRDPVKGVRVYLSIVANPASGGCAGPSGRDSGLGRLGPNGPAIFRRYSGTKSTIHSRESSAMPSFCWLTANA